MQGGDLIFHWEGRGYDLYLTPVDVDTSQMRMLGWSMTLLSDEGGNVEKIQVRAPLGSSTATRIG